LLMRLPLVCISLSALLLAAASPVMAQSLDGLGGLPSGILSRNSTAVPAQQSQQAMTTGLCQPPVAARHAAEAVPQTRQVAWAEPNDWPSIHKPSRWSAYALGGVGDSRGDWNLDGTTGLIAEVAPGLHVGAGVIGAHGTSDLNLGGSSRMNAAGGSIIAAYEQPEGLRLYGSAFVAHLAVDTTRRYHDGAGLDRSNGATDGIGYGSTVRGGWAFPVRSSVSVVPYAEFQWSKANFDGYTETGGAFPAHFSDQTSRRLTSRLGVEVDYRVTRTLELRPRVAWGHKLVGKGGSLAANTMGLTQVLNPAREDRNWAEGAVVAAWKVANATTLLAEVGGRTEPAVKLTIGMAVAL
jgi:uncharacterized protein YhjY with autotransporter beta-barrel domain